MIRSHKLGLGLNLLGRYHYVEAVVRLLSFHQKRLRSISFFGLLGRISRDVDLVARSERQMALIFKPPFAPVYIWVRYQRQKLWRFAVLQQGLHAQSLQLLSILLRLYQAIFFFWVNARRKLVPDWQRIIFITFLWTRALGARVVLRHLGTALQSTSPILLFAESRGDL